MPRKSAEPLPEIEIVVADSGWRRALPRAQDLVRTAADAALSGSLKRPPKGVGPICVVLTGDAEIRPLNARFRGFDKPTNVLSFNHLTDAPGAPFGDVVLARETIAREAREQGKMLKDHVSHLVVHGILHLLGYDHEQSAQARRMEELERAILARLSISDPYAVKALKTSPHA